MIDKPFQYDEDLKTVGFIWHYLFLLLVINKPFQYVEDIKTVGFLWHNLFSLLMINKLFPYDEDTNMIGFNISEPIFYSDLVYKFKRIVGKPYFSDQFKKIVKRYIRVGYNLDIMRQSACLVLNPITVYSFGFLFNCTTVGQASDSMTALT